jgi:sugar lactone lactonase YvrE
LSSLVPAYFSMQTPTFIPRLLLSCTLVVASIARGAVDYSAPFDFTTLAGLSSVGSADGPGNMARFSWPSSLAIDSNDNLYVTDESNHTIRKITPAGIVSTLAGTPGVRGTADGSGSTALFINPEGIAVDNAGNVYVADKVNSAIRKISPIGVVTTLAGLPGRTGSVDGTGSDARFYAPGGVAVDATGNIFVADTLNNTIRKITPAGLVTTLAGQAGVFGKADGTGANASFFYPLALAIDSTGNLYTAEIGNYLVRKITPAGVVTTVSGNDGPIISVAITIDRTGNLFASNKGTIRKVKPDGTSTILAGTENVLGSADGTGAAAQFRAPFGFVADSAGNVFVADRDNNTIRKITPAGVVTTFAGLAPENSTGTSDGMGSAARFKQLASTAVAPSGDVYVADSLNSVVRKISPAGVVTTVAGSAGQKGNADGKGNTARFSAPYGIAIDPSGNAYVTDTGNHTIRKISTTGDVTTVAGLSDGTSGSVDGSNSVARFSSPSGIALDPTGNLLIADKGNHTIRKVSTSGEVTTLAGASGSTGATDGRGAAARFSAPAGITVGEAGSIYVADSGNHLIRKLLADGTVTTLAGTTVVDPDPLAAGADGTGSSAHFQNPYGIVAGTGGTLYVADSGNNTIRKINASGGVTTLAGIPSAAGNADGAGKDSRFLTPPGISLDAQGILYVTSGTTVRRGQLAGPPVISTQPTSQTVVAGNSVQLSVVAAGAPAPTYQWYFNGTPFNGATSNTLSFSNARTTDAGDYTVIATNSLGSITSTKATLTITSSPTPAPPATGGTSGGGGGSVAPFFVMMLLGLLLIRGRSLSFSHRSIIAEA